MFTGIIEELGVIEFIYRKSKTLELTISTKKIINDISNGDSIAVNGVCLTVTKFNKKCFTVDIMPQTFDNTSLKYLSIKDFVNLERALPVGGRLGGHFVSGHIDTTGIIIKTTNNDNAKDYIIKPNKIAPELCIQKGSIAIDGTSLTIFATNNGIIELSLIPHTIKNSVIGNKKIGDVVNIEYDMLAKYVESIVGKSTLGISKDKQMPLNIMDQNFLHINGFD